MSQTRNVPHELAQEFPGHIARMQEMRKSDPEFARLFDEYDVINRKVMRAETLEEPMEELAEVALRKVRLSLKDQIWRALCSQE